jgi:hypothetical protein
MKIKRRFTKHQEVSDNMKDLTSTFNFTNQQHGGFHSSEDQEFEIQDLIFKDFRREINKKL